jgi:MFS transporter, PPP family, 3-phenylpropionic acid transporter
LQLTRAAFALSAFWFCSLGALGIFFPFFSLYLRENVGLAGWQVGALLAVPPIVAVAAQPAWGVLADRTGSRARVLCVLALGSAAGYASLALGRDFAWLLALTSFAACFTTPLVPTAVAVTFALAPNVGAREFGRYRVWGTVGYGVFVVGFPYLLAAISAARGTAATPDVSQPALAVMFPVTAGVMLVAAAIAFALPRSSAPEPSSARGEWRRLLAHRPFVRLSGVTFLGYVALQGPMGIFPIFVRAHGGGIDTVSHLWVLMLTLELPLIAFLGASLQRVGPRGLLATGLVAGGVRWLVCGFAPESEWMVPVQVLHGIVVAGLVIGSPLYVEAVVPEQLRATGQNLLAVVGVSVGGLVSFLGAGWLIDASGVDTPYRVGGIAALAVAALLPWWLPPPQRAGMIEPESNS